MSLPPLDDDAVIRLGGQVDRAPEPGSALSLASPAPSAGQRAVAKLPPSVRSAARRASDRLATLVGEQAAESLRPDIDALRSEVADLRAELAATRAHLEAELAIAHAELAAQRRV